MSTLAAACTLSGALPIDCSERRCLAYRTMPFPTRWKLPLVDMLRCTAGQLEVFLVP